MSFNRREFLNWLANGITSLSLASIPLAHGNAPSKIKAIAFDAFAIFDPRPVFVLAEQLFPGKGTELSNVWRTRQFEYQWLRALSGQYADFWHATEDSLVYAAESLKLELPPDKHKQLMHAYLELKTWSDAPLVLRSLKNQGIRLALLSNATPTILEAGLINSAIADNFEHVLSTDQIKTYKPDPRAYQMAVDAFGIKRDEILFVAFAGWDAAGAKSFGYTTFWVNRLKLPYEQLSAVPDAASNDLNGLLSFIKTLR